MKNDRLRVPVDDAYLLSIGRATYCFARLEWDAVYCGEKLNAGYLSTVSVKTAGNIAIDVAQFVSYVSDPLNRDRYRAATIELSRLVKRRNDLVHSNTATVNGEQRLVRRDSSWQPSDIDDLADEFTACSIELNDLFHHIL